MVFAAPKCGAKSSDVSSQTCDKFVDRIWAELLVEDHESGPPDSGTRTAAGWNDIEMLGSKWYRSPVDDLAYTGDDLLHIRAQLATYDHDRGIKEAHAHRGDFANRSPGVACSFYSVRVPGPDETTLAAETGEMLPGGGRNAIGKLFELHRLLAAVSNNASQIAKTTNATGERHPATDATRDAMRCGATRRRAVRRCGGRVEPVMMPIVTRGERMAGLMT